MKTINWIAAILLIVGGLNWLLIGLFGFDLIAAIFVNLAWANIVYILVGLSALYGLFVFLPKMTK